MIEALEAREVPVIDAPWTAIGPDAILNGQTENVPPNDRVIGAVQAVAAHPTNANTLFAGAVNGGIWRTTNAQSANPTWTPLIDEQDSLSIGDMKFSANDVNTIVAGIGRTSSFGRAGTELTGLLISRDGGNNWTPLSPAILQGENIISVEVSGPVGNEQILAAASGFGGIGGVYRSTNGGVTFARTLTGPISDLVADPLNPNRLWASRMGATGGIFFSTDGGATWANVTQGAVSGDIDVIDGTTNNIKLAAFNDGAVTVVWAGIVNDGQAAGFFYTTDEGALNLHDTWVAMDVPVTNEGGSFIGLQPRRKPGSQGNIHFALAADPNSPNLVYVGGDRQPNDGGFPNSIGATNFTGRLFRGDRTQPSVGPNQVSPQWTPLTHVGTTSNSAPHADSRDIVFDAIGVMVQGDDGGIYRRTNPTSTAGDWFSLNGNLQITEFHSVDYDALSNRVAGGTQDVGTVAQSASAGSQFDTVNQGDGGVVQIDDSQTGSSIVYTSSQNFGGFQRATISAGGQIQSVINVGLSVGGGGSLTTVDNTIQFYQPFTLNNVNSSRMLVGTDFLYESFDRGDNLQLLNSPISQNGIVGTVSALDYGGFQDGVGNEGVFYIASTNGIFFRERDGGPVQRRLGFPGGQVRDLVMDPDNWSTVYAVDASNVYQSQDAGISWVNITANLSIANDLQTITFVEGIFGDAIVVGGEDGVARALVGAIVTAWDEVGPTLLPNAEVRDLRWDARRDVLLAGTLGRGAFVINTASAYLTQGFGPLIAFDVSDSMILPQSIDVNGDSALTDGDDIDGDGAKGTGLDHAIYVFTQAAAQGRLSGDVSISIFGRDAEFLDMSSAPGLQVFTTKTADSDNNGVLDVIEIAQSIRVGGGGHFMEARVDPSRTFFDSALNLLGTQAGAAIPPQAQILTDGSGLLSSNRAALINYGTLGIQTNVVVFGGYRAVGSLSHSSLIAGVSSGTVIQVPANAIIDNALFAVDSLPQALPGYSPSPSLSTVTTAGLASPLLSTPLAMTTLSTSSSSTSGGATEQRETAGTDGDDLAGTPTSPSRNSSGARRSVVSASTVDAILHESNASDDDSLS